METSAPKRRRTSPRTSVQVFPEHRVAAQAEAESTTPKEPLPEPAAASKRPSFASPTKASLERHNPEIALRRRTQSPPKRGPSDQNAPPAPHSRSSADNPSREQGPLDANAQSSHEDTHSQRSLRGGDVTQGQGVLRSPARRLGRPSQIPKPRPLPPPVPDEEEEILNPFARRGLRRSPPPGVLPEVVVEEPELPPTPEHPDPVVSTPPSGIHNTPSRRPRRSKALAERLKSSSPLKNVAATSSPDHNAPPPIFKLPPKPSKLGEQSHSIASQGPTTAELRGIEPEDPDAEKRKQRDALLAEIAELERDLAIASAENSRLLSSHVSKTAPSPPPNADQILDLLRRHALPPEKEPPTTPWLASALNPIAFLPFAKPTTTPPTLFTDPSEDDDRPPPTSHHPLPMTAEEALPYLQAFSPLTFTSQIATLPLESPDAHLLQKHIISATSTAPRGLFSARIEMTVDTRFMSITELAVPKLDPSAAAELAPFIKQVTTSMSSGLGKNISVLGWAMGEWVRLATQRAKVWCVLDRELGSGTEAVREMVERTRVRRRRKRRREMDVDSESDEEEEEGIDKDGKKMGMAELLPFMGRTSMDFEVPVLVGGEDVSSMLRVQWKIAFDWTGEGRSELGVLVGVPGKWHKHDQRGRLAGISGLFDDLIRGGEDPLTAVRTVACLLAGKEGGKEKS